MTKISILISKQPIPEEMDEQIEIPEGVFSIRAAKIDDVHGVRIQKLQDERFTSNQTERQLVKGQTAFVTSPNGISFLSLQTFNNSLRTIIAQVLSKAFFQDPGKIQALSVSERTLEKLYQLSNQVLECRIQFDHDEITLEDINLRDFRKFSELKQLGEIIEMLTTLEWVDNKGIFLVRILKDGRFTISPDLSHLDAFLFLVKWLESD